ncbi:Dabb family protein [Streptomyces sp. NPDC058307]|uniref:Dabb family protein n=1 Tax=Streptomyces sp. NPDC058307 TaxID=3346439 RepID=UPI0036ED0F72
MIYHINRVTTKATATPEQIEGVLESWRNQGRSNPVIKSFVVGRDHGGDYTYGAVFVVEHREIFDVSDDDDPDLNAKIQELHRRRHELNPQIAGMLADVPTCTGSGVDD